MKVLVCGGRDYSADEKEAATVKPDLTVGADDQAALIRTLRASLAGAEQERDAAITDTHDTIADLQRSLETAEAERDAALRLLADQTGQTVSSRDFTTVAGAVLAARPACDPADPCAFAQDLAAKNGTLDGLLDEATERAKDAEAAVSVSGGVAAIAAERRRQTEVEGWTPEHDDAHGRGDMPRAAACYAWVASLGGSVRELTAHFDTWHELPVFRTLWPWDRKWWKPTDPRRDLVKAGALIAAEIDRLDRAALAEQEAGE